MITIRVTGERGFYRLMTKKNSSYLCSAAMTSLHLTVQKLTQNAFKVGQSNQKVTVGVRRYLWVYILHYCTYAES